MQGLRKACLASLCCFPMLNAHAIEILNVYPDCQYEVMGKKAFKQKLRGDNGAISETHVDLQTQKIIQQILERGAELGAHGAIITRKKVQYPDNMASSRIAKAGHVTIFAEFTPECTETLGNTAKITPYDSEGRKQRSGQAQTASIPMSFEIPGYSMKSKSAERQPLASNNIDIEAGVFGLRLGMSTVDVEKVLGKPTSELTDNSVRLVSYGRRFWLVYSDDALVMITNKNRWFSNELINHFDFDERFDDQQWTIMDNVSQGVPSESLAETLSGEFSDQFTYAVTNTNGQVLHIHLKQVIEEKNVKLSVAGYSFFTATYDDEVRMSDITTASTSFYENINTLIHSRDGDNYRIAPDAIQSAPLLKATNTQGHTLHVYDKHLALVFDGDQLSHLHIVPSVLIDDTDTSSWSFGTFYSGQSEAEFEQQANDSAFKINHIWRIAGEREEYRLVFDEVGADNLLSSLNVKLY